LTVAEPGKDNQLPFKKEKRVSYYGP
jgi:hypothetical protein